MHGVPGQIQARMSDVFLKCAAGLLAPTVRCVAARMKIVRRNRMLNVRTCICNHTQDPAATVIVSVSPQSRASLAARQGLTPGQAQRKLAALFRGLGAAHVLDLGLARDMALLEAAAEFVARYRARAEAAQRLSAGAHHLRAVVSPRLAFAAAWARSRAVISLPLCPRTSKSRTWERVTKAGRYRCRFRSRQSA